MKHGKLQTWVIVKNGNLKNETNTKHELVGGGQKRVSPKCCDALFEIVRGWCLHMLFRF